MCVDCGGGSVCEHGKRKQMCYLCSVAAPADDAAAPRPAKKFAREDYLRILKESSPGSSAAAVTPVSASSTFHYPSAAENFASIVAAATSVSNFELLKFLEASGAHLPSVFPLLNPFLAPMLMGMNPLIAPRQSCSSPAPPLLIQPPAPPAPNHSAPL
jgi:hypothetical protein